MVLVNSGRVGSCHIYLQRVFERKRAFFVPVTHGIYGYALLVLPTKTQRHKEYLFSYINPLEGANFLIAGALNPFAGAIFLSAGSIFLSAGAIFLFVQGIFLFAQGIFLFAQGITLLAQEK